MKTPYPDFDALHEWEHWDEKTQAVIRKRLEEIPRITFFSHDEVLLLQAVVDRILPQPDRPLEQRIPIVPFIDEMLTKDDTEGFRESDMPWHQEMWKLGLQGINETSQAIFSRAFTLLSENEQNQILKAIQDGNPTGQTWQRLPSAKFFRQLVEQIASIYYAHPAAWNEIGWTGPASPRGYVRLGYGMGDPWDSVEKEPSSSVAIIEEYERKQLTAGAGEATH